MINNTDKPFKVLLAQIKNNYDLEANTHRINISLQKYTLNDQIDLVLFPEIALTGYSIITYHLVTIIKMSNQFNPMLKNSVKDLITNSVKQLHLNYIHMWFVVTLKNAVINTTIQA